MVLRQGLALSLVGVTIGLGLSVGLTRLMSGLLFGVSPTDPVTYGAVALGLVAVALVASYLPTLILSGFVFAISSMPVPLQWLTYIVPARYFIVLLRGIYLKGIGLEIMWLSALLLSIYAGIMIMVAHKRMKLKLE